MANVGVFVGVVASMLVLVLGLGIFAISGGVTADVVQEVRADEFGIAGCNATTVQSCSALYNITTQGLEGQQELANQSDNIGQVGGLALIILMLVSVFGIFFGRKLFG